MGLRVFDGFAPRCEFPFIGTPMYGYPHIHAFYFSIQVARGKYFPAGPSVCIGRNLSGNFCPTGEAAQIRMLCQNRYRFLYFCCK